MTAPYLPTVCTSAESIPTMSTIAQELYNAAQIGDDAEIRRLLELPGADPNARGGASGRCPLQAAALDGHVEVVKRLLECPEIDANATPEDGVDKKTPLHMAAEQGHREVVKLLLAHPSVKGNAQLVISGLTPLHLATWGEHCDVVEELLQWPMINVNQEDNIMKRTPLHLAVERGNTRLVRLLTAHSRLSAIVEDYNGKTALQLAVEHRRKDIAKLLDEREDVSHYLDRLYRDRQVCVDAANAILVGAALIASVTFAGWLQPPLGFTTYYGSDYAVPYPAPPGTYESFAAVQQHRPLRIFWVFNSLSFFMAIGTVIAAAGAILPMQDIFIKEGVTEVRRALVMASFLLVLSLICVLGAFGAAGMAALPPLAAYNSNMIVTMGVGAAVCISLLLWFSVRIYRLRPRWWRMMEELMLPAYMTEATAPPIEQSLSQQYGKEVRRQVRKRQIAAKKRSRDAVSNAKGGCCTCCS